MTSEFGQVLNPTLYIIYSHMKCLFRCRNNSQQIIGLYFRRCLLQINKPSDKHVNIYVHVSTNGKHNPVSHQFGSSDIKSSPSWFPLRSYVGRYQYLLSYMLNILEACLKCLWNNSMNINVKHGHSLEVSTLVQHRKPLTNTITVSQSKEWVSVWGLMSYLTV